MRKLVYRVNCASHVRAHQAHDVGGLIGGALVAGVIQLGDRYRAQALAFVACVVIAVAAVAGSLATAKSSEVETGTQPTFLNPES